MCPSIHSLIRSFTPSAFVTAVSDGNGEGLARRIPRISVPPQNSPAAAAAPFSLSFRRSLSAKPYGWAIVDFNAIHLDADSNGNTSVGNRISQHLWNLPPSLARSLAMPAVSIAKGQMGEKPRTYGFSFFLSSRLLTPLPERVREPRKKPFTVGQCGSAAVAVIMAWDGIGLSSACRQAFTLGSLARSGSNSNFQWMDRCQSVSQSASE